MHIERKSRPVFNGEDMKDSLALKSGKIVDVKNFAYFFKFSVMNHRELYKGEYHAVNFSIGTIA